MANLKQILSNSANKSTNRAKKIAQGVKKTAQAVNNAIADAKTAVAKAARAKEILSEIVLLKIKLSTDVIEYKKELNKIDNRFQLGEYGVIGILSEINYVLDRKKIDEYYNKLSESTKDQIATLQEEYDKIIEGNFGLKKTEAERLARLKADELFEKNNSIKNKLKFPKIKLPKSFNDIVNALNTVLGILFQFISVNNSKITEAVDKANSVISSITNKTDVEKAKLLKNQALSLINTNKNAIENANKIISIINLIDSILNPLISILYILPPLAITGATIKTIQKLQKILDDSSALLDTADLVINKLLDDLNYQETRLLQINDILDLNLENLSPSEIQSLVNDTRNGLGYLKGYDYKGFKFYLKEENDPNFEIKGNKRRYATALNEEGNEVLKSNSSFTLEPDILVEELKLIIDEKNLVA
jgi:hypothetical protein